MFDTFAGALRDFAKSWRTLIATDLVFKVVSFAILTPVAALVLRWLLSRSSGGVVADADIARFFFTSIPGLIALIGGLILGLAFSALEAASLMAVAFAATRGSHVSLKSALSFSVVRAGAILRVVANMVMRVLAAIVPFLLAIGAIYLLLLRGHDINYFLKAKPPVFWVAAVLVGLVAVTFVSLAIRTITRWTLAFPILLFENVSPRTVLREAAARSEGIRGFIAAVLAIWAVVAFVVSGVSAFLVRALARTIAPRLSESSAALITFLAAVAIVWGVVAFITGAINFSLFAALVVRIWNSRQAANVSLEVDEQLPKRIFGGKTRLAIAAVVILCATALAVVAFFVTRRNERVLVLAHRGSSIAAPENTLSAFRRAIEEDADMIELDVQESRDGEVLVVHDSDLMKVAGSPMKIWEHTAAELRSVDIGKNERVPTLAEVLEECRGKIRVMVELKSYGHAQNLEERVAQLVEKAEMQNDTAFMSLNHDMVRQMKRVRPQWRVGALAAKALGDPSKAGADFLAVETSMATARMVRRAHRAGQDVYVWTVNDPAAMLAALSRGVDGLITDKPAVAREIVERRAKMSDAERLLVALMLRAGVEPPAESATRP